MKHILMHVLIPHISSRAVIVASDTGSQKAHKYLGAESEKMTAVPIAGTATNLVLNGSIGIQSFEAQGRKAVDQSIYKHGQRNVGACH